MLNFVEQTDENLALRTWHYPIINDSDREFQQKIIESSLMRNTLVCLPTGLGKTFIGLATMYNFHRWFPSRKIIFMAPTRPLVNQQYRAWTQLFSKQLNIIAIEITGSMGPEKRHQAWSEQRIFFTTPQVLENDLKNNIIEKESIVCLIIDEAHKSVGNYAYCSIVKILSDSNVKFRICALTATPGSTVSSIQNLINSLKIETTEFISESSEDIKSYVCERTREVVTVPADPTIESINTALDDIIKTFYILPLKNFNMNLSEDIDAMNIVSLPSGHQSGAVDGYLAGLRVMIHLRDLLVFYGINSMLAYIESLETGHNTPLKSRIRKQLSSHEAFQQLMLHLRTRITMPTFLSHPKLKFLGQILKSHFESSNSQTETRAMVFSNYRESVLEICQYLKNTSSSLRPAPLLGQSQQGDGVKNGKLAQQNTIESFIQGSFNILVATCIGEEGLDIGLVDLIVFYDAHSSPIRLLQRSGRTGRQRNGRIVILVNEKKEKRLLENSETNSKMIENVMLNSATYFKFFDASFQNPVNCFIHPIQMVKFKMTIPDKQEKTKLKRSISYAPRKLPSVSNLDPNNAIIRAFVPHSIISHSSSTHALVENMLQIKRKEKSSSRCLSIWKQGLKSMPIFKIYNYTPNNAEDYKLFYKFMNCEEPKIETVDELPDNFFDADDLEFAEEEIFEESFTPDLSFDWNQSADQLDEFKFDDQELEGIDWSDSEF